MSLCTNDQYALSYACNQLLSPALPFSSQFLIIATCKDFVQISWGYYYYKCSVALLCSTPDRMAYIRVLRWDCCWSFLDGGWLWQCGWRRVIIQARPKWIATTTQCPNYCGFISPHNPWFRRPVPSTFQGSRLEGVYFLYSILATKCPD